MKLKTGDIHMIAKIMLVLIWLVFTLLIGMESMK